MLLLVGMTLALAWVVWPFAGAIFWAVVLAILFEPLYARLLGFVPRRRTVAALATVLVCIAGVGVPLALLTAMVLRQGASFYADVASRKIDFDAHLQRVTAALPSWVFDALDTLGLGDFATVQAKLAGSAGDAGRFLAGHVFSVSVDSFGFLISLGVMLYLLFFLLRDGPALAVYVDRLLPLAADERKTLAGTFVTVIKATVKGGAVMAATQGVLGGAVLGFMGIPAPLLWGVVFGLLSMLPAVGASLLWLPIAVYFLVVGAVWKAAVLTLFGTFVLTVIDNVLRPLVVGQDTHLPGYLVLISTLGGVATFGLNGVVIGPVAAALCVASWKQVSSQPGVPASGSATPSATLR